MIFLLGPRSRLKLLDIFNLSFSIGKLPQIWKLDTILSLNKLGKLLSYRPVSLASCVAKMLERIIVYRLYYLAKTCDWLCTN